MSEYPCCDCGGKIIDGEPHYIPFGTDSVLRIVDQVCTECGANIIGKHQKTKIFVNQKAHDMILNFVENALQEGETVPIKHYKSEDDAEKKGGSSEQIIDLEMWQRYASPVWFDIKRTDVLNVKVAQMISRFV